MRKAIGDTLANVLGRAVVGEATDGREAVDLSLALRPNLVVMDVHMPAMSGLEALRRLRTELPDTHFVMISTFVEPEVRDIALSMGADACLEKGPELFGGLPDIVERLNEELKG